MATRKKGPSKSLPAEVQRLRDQPRVSSCASAECIHRLLFDAILHRPVIWSDLIADANGAAGGRLEIRVQSFERLLGRPQPCERPYVQAAQRLEVGRLHADLLQRLVGGGIATSWTSLRPVERDRAGWCRDDGCLFYPTEADLFHQLG